MKSVEKDNSVVKDVTIESTGLFSMNERQPNTVITARRADRNLKKVVNLFDNYTYNVVESCYIVL